MLHEVLVISAGLADKFIGASGSTGTNTLAPEPSSDRSDSPIILT
jgi:hypothetical protein